VRPRIEVAAILNYVRIRGLREVEVRAKRHATTESRLGRDTGRRVMRTVKLEDALATER
jgi:hypothetical protein